jgi:uncharacterized protein (TIGR02246 family)
MKKVFLCVSATLMFSLLLSAQTNKADEQSLRNIVSTIQDGWNEKSGEKFASPFADVHDYIVVNGLYLPSFGKKQNAAVHQQLFDGRYKNANLKLNVDKISFYKKDLAQITVIGANYPASEAIPKDPTAIMTLIVEKKADGWKIISFHNHELNMEEIKQASPMPVEVMYASWYKK